MGVQRTRIAFRLQRSSIPPRDGRKEGRLLWPCRGIRLSSSFPSDDFGALRRCIRHRQHGFGDGVLEKSINGQEDPRDSGIGPQSRPALGSPPLRSACYPGGSTLGVPFYGQRPAGPANPGGRGNPALRSGIGPPIRSYSRNGSDSCAGGMVMSIALFLVSEHSTRFGLNYLRIDIRPAERHLSGVVRILPIAKKSNSAAKPMAQNCQRRFVLKSWLKYPP